MHGPNASGLTVAYDHDLIGQAEPFDIMQDAVVGLAGNQRFQNPRLPCRKNPVAHAQLIANEITERLFPQVLRTHKTHPFLDNTIGRGILGEKFSGEIA